MENVSLTPIGHVRSGFSSRFGIPRQSGIVDVPAVIEMTASFRDPNCFRGIEEFSDLWIIWGFSESRKASWSPTVRPPKLGGNTRIGVFASRSPFRPNALALSCVRLDHVSWKTPEGPKLHINGADMLDGSPVYDIKPYVPADCRPQAATSFAGASDTPLPVQDPYELLSPLPQTHREIIIALLSADPRPAYQNDPARVYGMEYAGIEVRFAASSDGIRILECIHHGEKGPYQKQRSEEAPAKAFPQE